MSGPMSVKRYEWDVDGMIAEQKDGDGDWIGVEDYQQLCQLRDSDTKMIAELRHTIADYEQTSGDICATCGWRGVRGDKPCAFCEVVTLRKKLIEIVTHPTGAPCQIFSWSHGDQCYEDLKREAVELRAVCGPKMPCGCYAVECVRDGDRILCPRYGLDHIAVGDTRITPEYAEWRRSREGR